MDKIDSDRTQVAEFRANVLAVADTVAPYWPIDSFIAVNPLSGFEDQQFREAIDSATRFYGIRGTLRLQDYQLLVKSGRIKVEDIKIELIANKSQLKDSSSEAVGSLKATAIDLALIDLLHGPASKEPISRSILTRSECINKDLAVTIDNLTSEWCSSYYGSAQWRNPFSEEGFYNAWRNTASVDHTLPKKVRRVIGACHAQSDVNALRSLEVLRIERSEVRDYICAVLTRIRGWAGYIRWASEHGQDASLMDLVAVWLCYESAFVEGDPSLETLWRDQQHDKHDDDSRLLTERARAAVQRIDPSPSVADFNAARRVLEEVSELDRRYILQLALERGYYSELFSTLEKGSQNAEDNIPSAQLVCCIDTRTQRIRQAVKQAAGIETLGFAGFFAAAIRYRRLGEQATSDQCPALISPRNYVEEKFEESTSRAVRGRVKSGQLTLAAGEDGFTNAKYSLMPSFSLAEISGVPAAVLSAFKTSLPYQYSALRTKARNMIRPSVPTTVDIFSGYTFEERCAFAETALTMMGLVDRFSRLVVFTGHGSTNENNPYSASLHCGACGGNEGSPNARVAATTLNDPAVREFLNTRGISIPDTTWFLSAEHDTTTDSVRILDSDIAPASFAGEIATLMADLDVASSIARNDRVKDLPGASIGRRKSPRREVLARAHDWAQVYPEWGLAKNASIIIGPPEWTSRIDIQPRSFVHAYNSSLDESGAVLENILTAPVVVAQWINCQYYFSTTDPEIFGSGTKTVHNAIGGVGVLSGFEGDIRVGLPLQSVSDGSMNYHEPVRLMVVVQADLNLTKDIVDRNAVLKQLVYNQWVLFTARESCQDEWFRLTSSGWRPNSYISVEGTRK